MIVVTIDMWPRGDEQRQYRLGRMFIWNDGTGNRTRSNYGVAVRRKGFEDIHTLDPRFKATRTGEVRNYPRLAYNVWRLVCKALKSAFPEEA